MVLPAGHPFGCGGTALGAAGGGGAVAAAAGATGFGGGGAGCAAGICGGGVAGLATLAGGGEGGAVTGLAGVGSDDGVAGFPAGTCVGVAGLFAGDCVPGVIAAEGVVGTEGFALGGSGSGVAGFVLSPGTGDGATGVTAAEGADGDCFAAGVCDGGVLRLSRPAGDGVDVPGTIAAEGVVAVGVPGLAPPPGADDGVVSVVADGDVCVAGVDGDACEGAGAGFVLPGAGDGVLGAIAADGVLGVVGAPVADGRGCPFIPGNGWPGCGGCVAAEPGALGCAPPPCGDWV
jgi:hypothetical protein